MNQIPLVDLKAQHLEIAEELAEGWRVVASQGSFILGEEVAKFEQEFAQFSGVSESVGVGNGTDALELALRAAGIQEGDEVIVPVNTFIASALAIVRAGARPIFADCDPTYYLLDPEAIPALISPRTRGIMPVHLTGQMAPMDSLMVLARKYDLLVIEDAAQCQGARQGAHSAGSFGVAAGTSFYPGKNLGACGDAGAVLTNDASVAEKVRALRNWGSDKKYYHPVIGFNSRLDTLQAVALRIKLRRLDAWNARRAEAAELYAMLLASTEGVRLPAVLPSNKHVWHLYVVRIPFRDRVCALMQKLGISVGIHYPTPIHLQGAFSYMGHKKEDFPNAERLAGEILSLPMFPHITREQQERIVIALQQALKQAEREHGISNIR